MNSDKSNSEIKRLLIESDRKATESQEGEFDKYTKEKDNGDNKVTKSNSGPMSCPAGFLALDSEGRITEISGLLTELWGRSRENLLGKILWDEFPHEQDSPFHKKCREAIQKKSPLRFTLPSPISPKWMEIQLFQYNNGLNLFLFDITEFRQFESLRKKEERYTQILKATRQGIFDWDLESNKIYFCPRWKEILGYEESAITNNPEEWLNRLHPEDHEHVKLQIHCHLEDLTKTFHSEHRMLHHDGSYRWILCQGISMQGDEGKTIRFIGSIMDITDRKSAEVQLLHNAFHDVLTGLPNNALFEDRLECAINRGKRRRNYRFSVLLLDLKSTILNNEESMEHVTENKIISTLAQRLVKCLRPDDTVARISVNEFIILLDDISNIGDVTHIADRLMKSIHQPVNFDGHEINVIPSIGIVMSSIRYTNSKEILSDANVALSRAKQRGGVCYELFDVTMLEHSRSYLELENDLRLAVDQGTFHLHYQPIISLQTGMITGFEALLRWEHYQWGYISPTTFIPIAEETGLIIPIGEWVLREACRQVKEWQKLNPAYPPLGVNVNFSVRQFLLSDFARNIDNILREVNFDPRYFNLEITESVLIENLDTVAPLLGHIKSIGAKLFLDDFGTGYSSLSYLRRYPVEGVKIDRSFLRDLETDGKHMEIIRAIIQLAKNLDITVIAEGIETSQQLEKLQEINCPFGQGFYFSRPVPPEEVKQMLLKQFKVQ